MCCQYYNHVGGIKKGLNLIFINIKKNNINDHLVEMKRVYSLKIHLKQVFSRNFKN